MRHHLPLPQAQSASWIDRDGVTDRFSLRFHVTHWVAFTQILIRWPETVEVEHVYEANLLRQTGKEEATDVTPPITDPTKLLT